MPGGRLRRFLLHPGATEHAWWHRLVHDLAAQQTHAEIVVGFAIAMAVAVLVARRVARAAAVRHGRWLQIDPPAQPAADGGLALWRQLSPLLTTRPSLAGGRPPVCLEWTAEPGRLRVGLWCSRSVGLNAVTEAVQTDWPGAQVTTTDPPALLPGRMPRPGQRVSAARVRLSLPAWYPFETGDAKVVAGDEAGSGYPLRGLLAALAAPPAGGSAVLQVLARPASRRAVRKAHRAARALRAGVPLRSGPSAAVRQTRAAPVSGRADPMALADVRTITGKLTDAPLFQVAVRIAASSPPGRAGRRARTAWLRQVAGALGLYSGRQRLLLVRARRGGRALERRQPGRGFLAGVHELAALAHLPAQPSRYGLTVAPARAVAASTEVTHA